MSFKRAKIIHYKEEEEEEQASVEEEKKKIAPQVEMILVRRLDEDGSSNYTTHFAIIKEKKENGWLCETLSKTEVSHECGGRDFSILVKPDLSCVKSQEQFQVDDDLVNEKNGQEWQVFVPWTEYHDYSCNE